MRCCRCCPRGNLGVLAIGTLGGGAVVGAGRGGCWFCDNLGVEDIGTLGGVALVGGCCGCDGRAYAGGDGAGC